MIFRRATTCLLMLAAIALPCLGQTRSTSRNSYSIAGNVRDDAGQHTMENVRVDLKLDTGVPINTTFTRGNGEFEFGSLGNGEYVIEVDLKDYEPFRQPVTINNGSQRGVSIFLSRPMPMGQVKSGASVSAHELSVPRKAHDEYEKGLQLLYSKLDFQGALVQFQRAVKDFPTFYEAYLQVGAAYRELKQMAPAEEAMRKSVELSSGQYSEALFILSGFLNDTNRYADASTFARQGIEVEASSWHGPFELARALSGLKQLEEAEKNAIDARDMKPDYAPTYLILANIHIQLRNLQGLSRDLAAYLKLVPTGPDADQARKTQENLQAAIQAENEAQANARQKPRLDAQDTSRVNPPPTATERQLPPPPEPDSSGLPSLPPPQDNQY